MTIEDLQERYPNYSVEQLSEALAIHEDASALRDRVDALTGLPAIIAASALNQVLRLLTDKVVSVHSAPGA